MDRVVTVSSREELGDYMVDRLTQEWFQEVMMNCQEIDSSDLAALRSLGLAVAIDRAAAGPVEGGGAAANHTYQVPVPSISLMVLNTLLTRHATTPSFPSLSFHLLLFDICSILQRCAAPTMGLCRCPRESFL